jgi:hypothetical protein
MKHEETPLIPFEIVTKFLPLLLFFFFSLFCFSFAELSALWTKGKHTYSEKQGEGKGLICSSSSSGL